MMAWRFAAGAGRRLRRSVLALGLPATLVVGGFAVAVEPTVVPWPAPGEYRIDSDTTMTTGTGLNAVARQQRVDGTTGRMTVETREARPGGVAATQVYPGDGPNRFCVRVATAPPPPSSAGVCRDTPATVQPGSATARATCDGFVLDERWTRLDDRTWTRVLKSTPTGGSRAPDRRTAGPAAPVQRPSPIASPSALAALTAELEQQARSPDPEEAASAREQLALLRNTTTGPAAVVTPTVESKETWHRIAESCKGG